MSAFTVNMLKEIKEEKLARVVNEKRTLNSYEEAVKRVGKDIDELTFEIQELEDLLKIIK